MHHPETENKTSFKEFKTAVNMSAKELQSWLATEESKSVGMKNQEGDESTGHESGRQLVDLLHKKDADYTEEDYGQIRRVVSYIHRHSAQRPSSDIEHSRWRYSLKNWGHDPLKD